MPGNLLSIGRSGALAARSALELTAQNIANANNENYARRTAGLSELVTNGSMGGYASSAPGGVRVDSVIRSDSLFLHNQTRRTGSDLARADAELLGLRNAEAAVEQSGLYSMIVEFEAAIARLDSDPLDGSLRAAVLEAGRSLAKTFNIADTALGQAGEQARFDAGSGVDIVNLHAGELARINSQIVRSKPGSSSHAALLDQRDTRLAKLSGQAGITVEYGDLGVASVRLGDSSGPLLVDGTSSTELAVAPQPDGTVGFTLGAAPVAVTNGALAGHSQALEAQRDLGMQLDALAASTIRIVNDAQAAGVGMDGAVGPDFFSGNGASDIAMSLTDGARIATAPAGSPANSRDTGNLEALRGALATGGPASQADRLLFQLANAVSGREVTRGALATIAGTAQTELAAETGVDVDAEAANLVRFQQAFQASGRVIQVASDVFDTILGLR